MGGRQNRDINADAVKSIWESSWRKPSTAVPKSTYDQPPPCTEPGTLAFLRRDEQIPQNAIIRTQVNPHGLDHPVLILHKDAGGILHCLALTSFNDSGHLSPRAKLSPKDYRFVTDAPEHHAIQVQESAVGGRPLVLNSQPEKTCWVDQSRVLKVELESLKVYINGRHKVDKESLEEIIRYCNDLLPDSMHGASPRAQSCISHRRSDSGYASDSERCDPRKLDSWRR